MELGLRRWVRFEGKIKIGFLLYRDEDKFLFFLQLNICIFVYEKVQNPILF